MPAKKTHSTLFKGLLAAATPSPQAAGLPTRNTANTPQSLQNGSVDGAGEGGNRKWKTLYLSRKDRDKLGTLTDALFVADLKAYNAVAIRAALHTVDLKRPGLDTLADEGDMVDMDRVNMAFYPEDAPLWKEIAMYLRRSGQTKVNDTTIARLVIRAANADDKFMRTARDLAERYDRRTRKRRTK
jgi:hypothetical protein